MHRHNGNERFLSMIEATVWLLVARLDLLALEFLSEDVISLCSLADEVRVLLLLFLSAAGLVKGFLG